MVLPPPQLGAKPGWLTFDCYGTLIQWDEGLLAAVRSILAKHKQSPTDPRSFIRAYDAHEHELEASNPHLSFRTISRRALLCTMDDLGLPSDAADGDMLTSSISRMPPFPEVVGALGDLKKQGFKFCIISNSDDDIIAGNVAQLGGFIDRVVTAEQAQAYKPTRQIFDYAYRTLGVGKEDIVHICASPQLDLVAARDLGFRCIWIDRGTGRRAPPDYDPDFVFPTLDKVPQLFARLGWS